VNRKERDWTARINVMIQKIQVLPREAKLVIGQQFFQEDLSALDGADLNLAIFEKARDRRLTEELEAVLLADNSRPIPRQDAQPATTNRHARRAALKLTRK